MRVACRKILSVGPFLYHTLRGNGNYLSGALFSTMLLKPKERLPKSLTRIDVENWLIADGKNSLRKESQDSYGVIVLAKLHVVTLVARVRINKGGNVCKTLFCFIFDRRGTLDTESKK
jgi:hypothetical protein